MLEPSKPQVNIYLGSMSPGDQTWDQLEQTKRGSPQWKQALRGEDSQLFRPDALPRACPVITQEEEDPARRKTF